MGFPGGSAGKESACNVGDLDSTPGLGRSLGEGKGYPVQCSGLENSVDCTSPWGHRVRHDWATFTFTMVFLVVMYGCESWTIKKVEHWRIDPFGQFDQLISLISLIKLEKTLESLLDCKEIKSVNPKRNQSWIFIRRTGAEAEAPILWPSDVKSWLIREDSDAGKDWRQEKGTIEDEMVG